MQGTQYAPRESILCMEHFVALQSLIGGCSGSSESTLVKIPHSWKSYAMAHLTKFPFVMLRFLMIF